MATKYTKSFNEYIKQWEDAAANSVAGGGVDMAPNAMGKKALLKRFKSLKGVKEASKDDLMTIKNINETMASEIKQIL